MDSRLQPGMRTSAMPGNILTGISLTHRRRSTRFRRQLGPSNPGSQTQYFGVLLGKIAIDPGLFGRLGNDLRHLVYPVRIIFAVKTLVGQVRSRFRSRPCDTFPSVNTGKMNEHRDRHKNQLDSGPDERAGTSTMLSARALNRGECMSFRKHGPSANHKTFDLPGI
jgi:hypothetical protein